MSPSRAVCAVALVGALMVGCKESSSSQPDGSSPCTPGTTECRADGLYTCDPDQVFQLTEACTTCEAAPVPHCAVSCGGPGVNSICEGDSIKVCATSAIVSCQTGTCVPAGQEAVCVTKPGVSTCQGRGTDGTPYLLACADANGIAADQVCDLRTGECVAAEFSCPQLMSVPDDEVVCDAASGNFYTACLDGQPLALACEAGAQCSSDGSTNCYTAPTAGAACGGPTVCYPGLHCTQTAASSASCVQPAGQLACNSTDVLAVCTDVDTGVACVNGAVWWWRNLTTWGGSCTSNHVTVPAGGTCIPGLADCTQGLVCDRSPYDIAGICRPPAANAPADCTLTGQASTGQSCIYDWHSCLDGHTYDIDCQVVNVGGNIVTLCECSIDGTTTGSFGGSEICNVTTTAMLDARAMAGCGWDVTTVDVAP